MIRITLISVLLSVILLQSFVERASSACCNSDRLRRCGDNTISTPCCGYGKCNIFCCHCRGGCRAKKRSFEDMLTKLTDDAKERRQMTDSANEEDENENDIEEERALNNDDYGACKRQCLQGQLGSHRQAREIPDSIVKRGINDGNCKRACAYIQRSVDKE